MNETMTTTGLKSNASLALASNWLENYQGGGTASGGTTINGLGQCMNIGYLQPWYPNWTYPITYHYSEPARPIKLKLSEVDRLRKAAKSDKALRDILSKFTSQIEIQVDFD